MLVGVSRVFDHILNDQGQLLVNGRKGGPEFM